MRRVSLVVALVLAQFLLQGCRILQVVPANGQVVSASGNGDCAAGQTCTIDLTGVPYAGDTYTAVPDAGFTFVGWDSATVPSLCGGSNQPCPLPALAPEDTIAVDVFLSPVFEPTASCADTLDTVAGYCSARVNEAVANCYEGTSAACLVFDQGVALGVSSVESLVNAACADDSELASRGYPAGFTRADFIAQTQQQCRDTSAELAARAFAGPHAKVLNAAATQVDRDCLLAANRLAHQHLLDVSAAQSQCIDAGNCSGIATAVSVLESGLSSALTSACPADLLTGQLGMSQAQYVNEATDQAGCLTSQAYPSQSLLPLSCAPRQTVSASQVWLTGPGTNTALFDVATSDGTPSPVVTHAPARGQFVEIELDAATFGTRCGDGSNYRFWVQLASTGGNLTDVLVDLQGGGACFANFDCATAGSRLKNNRLDSQGAFPFRAFTNPDNASNPLNSWTKVVLPYCTQDAFIGGGATQNFTSISVERYGGVNLRVALDYARDVIRAAVLNEGGIYNSQDFNVVFHGTSAGSVGVSYNYHYVLDDLQWSNSAAIFNAALQIDDGTSPPGALQALAEPWNFRDITPAYCLEENCNFGEVKTLVHAERLGSRPLQNVAWVSDQIDRVGPGPTLPTAAEIVTANALRFVYCAIKDTPNVNFWLPARIGHVAQESEQSNGVAFRDWLATLVATGDVDDEVETSTMGVSGVLPFPCTVN